MACSLGFPIRTKILWFTLKPSMHQNPVMPPPNGGCMRRPVDITTSQSHAANLGLRLVTSTYATAPLNMTTLVEEIERLPSTPKLWDGRPHPKRHQRAKVEMLVTT